MVCVLESDKSLKKDSKKDLKKYGKVMSKTLNLFLLKKERNLIWEMLLSLGTVFAMWSAHENRVQFLINVRTYLFIIFRIK